MGGSHKESLIGRPEEAGQAKATTRKKKRILEIMVFVLFISFAKKIIKIEDFLCKTNEKLKIHDF